MPIFLGERDATAASATGIDYFKAIGLLDGMHEFIGDTITWTPFDGNFGLVSTTDETVNQFAAGAGASYIGWNLDAVYSKVFISVYGRGATDLDLVAQAGPINAAVDVDSCYIGRTSTSGNDSTLVRKILGIETVLQTNTNFFQNTVDDQGDYGFAFFVEGASAPAIGDQRFYTRNSMAQFWPLVKDTDSQDPVDDFRSVALRIANGGGRFVLPFTVWVGN